MLFSGFSFALTHKQEFSDWWVHRPTKLLKLSYYRPILSRL